jgi:CubicO group peptidase (beta-lactamase class C family)
MSSEKLADLMANIQKNKHKIRSVTVIRNGHMVADACFPPFQEDTWHIIHSCTKSVMSALVGIAVEEGCIESLDKSLLEFFPEKEPTDSDERKAAITLRHLLTMSSGLRTEDSYLYDWRGLTELGRSPDWIQHIFDLPMSEAPGTRFEYSNCVAFLLSAILQETTGMTALAFAREHLFGPMDISEVDWRMNPEGVNLGWSGIRMKPHDLAKLGLLYLNKGRWNGQQLVPAEWVTESTRIQIRSGTLSDGYGYQWWVDEAGYFMMMGFGGQFVIVHPEKNMVTVFNSVLIPGEFFTPEVLYRNFVIPAADASEALPADPGGTARLDSVIRVIENPEPAPTPELPEIAQTVSGRTFVFDPNPIDFKEFTLTFEPGRQEAELALSFGPKHIQVEIGLDDVHRVVRSEGYVRAYKGFWENEDTFMIDYEIIDFTERGGARMVFEEDIALVHVYGVIQNESHDLIGRLQE